MRFSIMPTDIATDVIHSRSRLPLFPNRSNIQPRQMLCHGVVTVIHHWNSSSFLPHLLLMNSRIALISSSFRESLNAGILELKAGSPPLAMTFSKSASLWCQVWPELSCGGGGSEPSGRAFFQFGAPSRLAPWQREQFLM